MESRAGSTSCHTWGEVSEKRDTDDNSRSASIRRSRVRRPSGPALRRDRAAHRGSRLQRDDHALVGIEVAVHRRMVFVDGRIAAGEGTVCVVSPEEVVAHRARRLQGRRLRLCACPGRYPPDPDGLDVTLDICLGPLDADERAIRDVSDDQAIAVGYACEGAPRRLSPAGAGARERVRRSARDVAPYSGRSSASGPTARCSSSCATGRWSGVSISVHHRPGIEWIALTSAARAACESVAAGVRRGGRAGAADDDVDWLVNGAGAFEIGGPEGDNGLSGQEAGRPGVWHGRADRRRRCVWQGPAEGRSAWPGDGAADGAGPGDERPGAGGDRVAGVAAGRRRAAVEGSRDDSCHGVSVRRAQWQ